jgi:hypothetical protein
MNNKQVFHWIENQTTYQFSDLQQKILKGSWEGRSYKCIAYSYSYNVQYVKDVAYRLWNLLSESCGEKITKKNFPVKIENIINASANTINKNTVNNYRDWSYVPDISRFIDRNKDLATLKQWIIEDDCRVVGIMGMGGIGKTQLSVKLGKEIEDGFEYIIWRSLRNPLSITDFLTDLIIFFTNNKQTKISNCLEAQISQLINFLKQHRCLLILNNIETILKDSGYAGQYSEEYQDYSQLFRQIALVAHQSCLILTSREKPHDLERMSGIEHPVRLLELNGLNYPEGKQIFQAIGNFSGSDRQWESLIQFYNGNPLLLEIVAHHIQAVFGGEIGQFLEEGKYIFDDLRQVLDRHLERLSNAEKEVIYCLATNWQPVSLAELKIKLRSLATKKRITDILQSLTRRLVIKTSSMGYALQPMLIEYINYQKTPRLIVASTKVVSLRTKC